MSGYFSLPRSFTRDPLWLDLPLAYQHVFLVLLDHACYKPQKFDDHGHIIQLEKWQLCMSHDEILKNCGKYTKRSDIERCIKKICLYQFARQEVRHRKTIITITDSRICGQENNSSEITSATNLRQTCDKLEIQKKKDKKEKNIDIDRGFPKIHSSELNGAHEQFGISEGFDSMAVKATLKHLKSEDLSIGNPTPFLRKCFQNTQDALVLAKSLEGKHSEHCTIHCGPDYLEFAMNGNCAPKIIRLTDKDFMESAKETALKLGIRL